MCFASTTCVCGTAILILSLLQKAALSTSLLYLLHVVQDKTTRMLADLADEVLVLALATSLWFKTDFLICQLGRSIVVAEPGSVDNLDTWATHSKYLTCNDQTLDRRRNPSIWLGKIHTNATLPSLWYWHSHYMHRTWQGKGNPSLAGSFRAVIMSQSLICTYYEIFY